MKTSQFNGIMTYSEDGTAHSQWIVGDKHYLFEPITPYACTNPFEELLTACSDLLAGRSGLIYWFHEPKITKITLAVLPDEENILVSISPLPLFGKTARLKSDCLPPSTFKINTHQFLVVIYYELQKLMSLHLPIKSAHTSDRFQAIKNSVIFPQKAFNRFKDAMNRYLAGTDFRANSPIYH